MNAQDAEYVLTVAEMRALDWVVAMAWLDRRGVPAAESLEARLTMYEQQVGAGSSGEASSLAHRSSRAPTPSQYEASSASAVEGQRTHIDGTECG